MKCFTSEVPTATFSVPVAELTNQNMTKHTIFSLKTNMSDYNSTEASASLMKFSCISRGIQYNKNVIIKLKGVSPQPVFSLRSFNLKMIHENTILEHKFHLMPENFPIPSNDIIVTVFKVKLNKNSILLLVLTQNEI